MKSSEWRRSPIVGESFFQIFDLLPEACSFLYSEMILTGMAKLLTRLVQLLYLLNLSVSVVDFVVANVVIWRISGSSVVSEVSTLSCTMCPFSAAKTIHGTKHYFTAPMQYSLLIGC